MRGKERGAGGSKGEGGEGGGEAVLFRQFLNCSLARSRSFSLFSCALLLLEEAKRRRKRQGRGRAHHHLGRRKFSVGQKYFPGGGVGRRVAVVGGVLWVVYCSVIFAGGFLGVENTHAQAGTHTLQKKG